MNLRANIVSAILTLCLVAVVNGQPQPAPTRNARSLTGFYPTGVYHFGDMETVNSQSGNVMLRIPLPGLAPGHAGLSAGINLLYNSQDLKSDANLWECNASRGPNFQWNLLPDSLKGGWRYGFDYQLIATEATTSSILGGGCSIQCPDKGATNRWQYALIFPDGSSHSLDPVPAASLTKENGYWNRNPAGPLRACKQESAPGVYSLVDVPNSMPSKLVLMTTDGTYIRVEADPSPTLVSWTAFMPDGSKIINGGGLPQRLVDRNSNSIRLGSAWNPVTGTVAIGIEDDLGRSVAITTNSTTLIDQIVAKSYQNSSNLVWQIYWKDIRPNRTYKPYSSRDTFTILPNEQPMPDRRVLWKVEFPSTSLNSSNVPQDTTQNYLFDYGESATPIAGTQIYLTPGTGEINSFTLPSGAKTEYAFTFTDAAVSQWASRNYYDRILRGKIVTKKLTYTQPAPAPGGVVAPASETWTYQIAENGSSSTVTAPNGALTAEGYNQGLLQSLTRPDGSITEKIWYENGPAGNFPVPNVGSGVFTDLMNPHPRLTLSSLPNAIGAPTATAITQTDLDPNGNAREEIAYNLVDYSAAHSGGLALLPASATVLRKTTRTFYAPANPSPPAGVEACTVAYYACANLGPNLRSAQTEKIETPVAVPGGVNQSMSAFCYDDAFTRGNLVHQASWDSARGTLPGALINCNLGRGGAATGVLVSSTGYDLKGNPIWQIDPKNSTTNIEYDSVSSTQCSVNPTFTQANPIVQLPYPARIRNPLNQQIQRIYDCPTGVLRTETDPNNVVRTNDYDRFGRLASSIVNGETSRLRYSDNDRYIVQIDDVDTPNDQKRFTVERFDPLGRRRLLQQSENGQMPVAETDGILTQFRYSPYAVGDNAFVSRPYRNADIANLATGWSVTRKDSAGRLTEVRHYSGNALPDLAVAATAGRDSWSYDGTTTIVTDADSKVRHERKTSPPPGWSVL